MPGPDPPFRRRAQSLEAAYIQSDDPVEQSGFGGGRRRWIDERSPLLDAIDRGGTFLDVGCANGLLASDVTTWASERGLDLEPFGIDLGEDLIRLTRARHPSRRSNFQVADAWEWTTDARWTYVYSLLELSPKALWCEWLTRLASWVEDGGRLIVGSYGSKSRREPASDVAGIMKACGFEVGGESWAGSLPVTRFAWSDV